MRTWPTDRSAEDTVEDWIRMRRKHRSRQCRPSGPTNIAKQIALLEKQKQFIEQRVEEIQRQIEAGRSLQEQKACLRANPDGPALVPERGQEMDHSEHLLPSGADRLVILLVDDEPTIRDITRMVLEGEGYFILNAADGEEALLLSRTFPGTIHLLLTDVDMPGLTGLQLIEQLREERPATRVLLMSGRVDIAAEQAFLPKPFGPDAVKARVREMLLPT